VSGVVTDVLGAPVWSASLEDFVSALAWAPDGSRLAVGSLGGESVLLDPVSGRVVHQLPHHELGVLSCAWRPDGGQVAVGGHDGRLHIAGVDGEVAASIDLGAWVAALAWRPDGLQLAAGAGRRLHVLDATGRSLLDSQETASTITAVAWAVNKRRVAAACYGGVSWYEVDHGRQPAKQFDWKGSVLCLAPSPDGRWLSVGAQDNTVHIWRLWSAEELEMNGYPTKVEHLAWHHGSRWMAVGNLGEITIWDFAGKGPGGRRPQQIEAHRRSISALAFQPRGDLLVSGARDGELIVWDTSGKVAREVARRSHPEAIAAVSWSPDGRHLAVATAGGRVDCHPVTLS
jgi:WD40 repeat protein